MDGGTSAPPAGHANVNQDQSPNTIEPKVDEDQSHQTPGDSPAKNVADLTPEHVEMLTLITTTKNKLNRLQTKYSCFLRRTPRTTLNLSPSSLTPRLRNSFRKVRLDEIRNLQKLKHYELLTPPSHQRLQELQATPVEILMFLYPQTEGDVWYTRWREFMTEMFENLEILYIVERGLRHIFQKGGKKFPGPEIEVLAVEEDFESEEKKEEEPHDTPMEAEDHLALVRQAIPVTVLDFLLPRGNGSISIEDRQQLLAEGWAVRLNDRGVHVFENVQPATPVRRPMPGDLLDILLLRGNGEIAEEDKEMLLTLGWAANVNESGQFTFEPAPPTLRGDAPPTPPVRNLVPTTLFDILLSIGDGDIPEDDEAIMEQYSHIIRQLQEEGWVTGLNVREQIVVEQVAVPDATPNILPDPVLDIFPDFFPAHVCDYLLTAWQRGITTEEEEMRISQWLVNEGILYNLDLETRDMRFGPARIVGGDLSLEEHILVLNLCRIDAQYTPELHVRILRVLLQRGWAYHIDEEEIPVFERVRYVPAWFRRAMERLERFLWRMDGERRRRQNGYYWFERWWEVANGRLKCGVEMRSGDGSLLGWLRWKRRL